MKPTEEGAAPTGVQPLHSSPLLQTMAAKQHAKRGPKGSQTRFNATKHMMERRTKNLTTCLFLLVGAISSLSPFLSLHLTNRVGLLLFESELVQLRSSLITVIICFLLLAILYSIIILVSRHNTTGQRSREISLSRCKLNSALGGSLLVKVQRILKVLVGVFALLSLLSYLALPLVVPRILQIQRAPMATFDCSANMITIENCQQQFTAVGANNEHSPATIIDMIQQLIAGDLSGNNELLAKRLECLKYSNTHHHHHHRNHYNDNGIQTQTGNIPPTRFLLHKCGLVCEPQRQHFHQFNDDLNSHQQSERPLVGASDQLRASTNFTPHRPEGIETKSKPGGGLVYLKLCFSGEINGAWSNYKRYCIENLTNGPRSATLTSHDSSPFSSQYQDRTLTVSQLNAILSRVRVDEAAKLHQQVPSDYQNVIAGHAGVLAPLLAPRQDQSTHYVNPIVQFESHFKNWPHLARANTFFEDQHQQQQQQQQHHSATSLNGHRANENAWCNYKPVPPFIVNNKPFSEIQCSLEHDYFMSTSQQSSSAHSQPQPVSRSRRAHETPSNRIYLRKSNTFDPDSEPAKHNERCNIQCKVDILYQVHSPTAGGLNKVDPSMGTFGGSSKVYYLPVKSCLIVIGDGDKWRTSNFYLIIRSVADATLLLAFISIDILLLLESIDTQQFQLEANKRRLFAVLVAITLLPLVAAALFDLAASWMPAEQQTNRSTSHRSFHDGYLINLVNEKLIPFVSDSLWQIIAQLYATPRSRQETTRLVGEKEADSSLPSLMGSNGTKSARLALDTPQELVVDHYLIPFLIYAAFMFALAISSFKMPLVGLRFPLTRMASTEELGLSADKRQWSAAAAAADTKEEANCQNDISQEAKEAQTKWTKGSQSARGLGKMSEFMKGASSSPEMTRRQASNQRLAAKKIVLFAILILFMGIQFNMSQLTQSQILLDTFSIHNDLHQQQQPQPQQWQTHHGQPQIHRLNERPSRAAVWLVLAANSSGTIFALVLALLFSDELSVFLAEFCPFKQMPSSRVENAQTRRQNELKFRKYLSISLLVYALRYFVLASMGQNSRMRWLLVILFQVAELMNFPLSWFVLTSRAHQLLAESANLDARLKRPLGTSQEETDESVASTIRLVNMHILVQSSLALIYFALGRFMALFIHSFHASLYLHSDNIDWFLSTFYEAQHSSANSHHHHQRPQTSKGNSSNSVPDGSTFSHEQSDALFAPLPSERQTYLHASRSLVKYNSLVCLAIGLTYVSLFASARYKQWRRQREAQRLEAAERQRRLASSAGASDLSDEQIGLDLKRIHAARTGAHESRQSSLAQATVTTSLTHLPGASSGAEHERPRARIHFRYDLGHRRDSSSSSSSTGASHSMKARPRVAFRELPQLHEQSTTDELNTTTPASNTPEPSPAGRSNEQHIPIILEGLAAGNGQRNGASSGASNDQQEASSEEQFVKIERVREQRHVKRIKLVADDENWSLGSANDAGPEPPDQFKEAAAQAMPFEMMATSPLPPGFGDSHEGAHPRDTPNDHDSSSAGREGNFPTKESGRPERASKRSRRCTAARRPAEQATQPDRNNKRITFAPTTTFIDQDGAQSSSRRTAAHSHYVEKLHARSVSQRRRQHIATPEPSIDENLDDERMRINESIEASGQVAHHYDGDSIDRANRH